MKRPGDRLRVLASRVCQPHAMERLIEPVLADLQCEYAAAQTRGQVWRGRWIRLAGYVAFWKVFGMHTAVRTVPAAREWLAADDRAIGRALGGVTVVATVVTAVLMLPPLRMLIRTANDERAYLPVTGREMGWLFLYLIPAALTIGIALGVPFGILWGLRGRVLSSSSRRAVAALAIAGALTGWFAQNTVMPAANQAFRQLIANHFTVANRGILVRGANELSLWELSARIEAAKRGGRAADAGSLLQSFYMRWVISVAPLVLGLFAIAVYAADGTGWKSMAIGATATIAYITFYIAITPSGYWSAASRVPPFTLAWIPNVGVVLLTIKLFLRSRGPANHLRPDSALRASSRSRRSATREGGQGYGGRVASAFRWISSNPAAASALRATARLAEAK